MARRARKSRGGYYLRPVVIDGDNKLTEITSRRGRGGFAVSEQVGQVVSDGNTCERVDKTANSVHTTRSIRCKPRT